MTEPQKHKNPEIGKNPSEERTQIPGKKRKVMTDREKKKYDKGLNAKCFNFKPLCRENPPSQPHCNSAKKIKSIHKDSTNKKMANMIAATKGMTTGGWTPYSVNVDALMNNLENDHSQNLDSAVFYDQATIKNGSGILMKTSSKVLPQGELPPSALLKIEPTRVKFLSGPDDLFTSNKRKNGGGGIICLEEDIGKIIKSNDGHREGRGEIASNGANNLRKTVDNIICIDIDDKSENDYDGYTVNNLSHVEKENDMSKKEINTCKKPGELLYSGVGNNLSQVETIGATTRNQAEPSKLPPKQSPMVPISPIAKQSVTSRNEDKSQDNLKELYQPKPLELQPKQLPIVPRYPIGCPIWFNICHSKPGSKYFDADKGVIRSISHESSANKMVYEVEQKRRKKDTILDEVKNVTFTVPEEELAFAVHCPVYVRTENGQNTEIEGEVIHVKPVIGEDGKRKYIYSVILTTVENRVRVEEGVVVDRIRYQLALQCLQKRIKDRISSPRNLKGVAIRTNDRGEPMLNRTPPVLKMKKRRALEKTVSKMKKRRALEKTFSAKNGGTNDDRSNDEDGRDISSNEEETGIIQNEEESSPKPAGNKCKHTCYSSNNDLSADKRKRKKKNSSYSGVSRRNSNRYEVRFTFNSKQLSLGLYKFEADGALAYDIGSKMLKGPNCKVNFSSKQDYRVAVQAEMEEAGQPINVTESFKSVLAKVETYVAKYIARNNVASSKFGHNASIQLVKATEKETMQMNDLGQNAEEDHNKGDEYERSMAESQSEKCRPVRMNGHVIYPQSSTMHASDEFGPV